MAGMLDDMMAMVCQVDRFKRSLFAPDSILSLPRPSLTLNSVDGNHSKSARLLVVISSVISGLLCSKPRRCCIATGEVPDPVR
jgi:hypothetical protein